MQEPPPHFQTNWQSERVTQCFLNIKINSIYCNPNPYAFQYAEDRTFSGPCLIQLGYS